MKKALIGVVVSSVVLMVAAILLIANTSKQLKKESRFDMDGKANYPSEWYDTARKNMRIEISKQKDSEGK